MSNCPEKESIDKWRKGQRKRNWKKTEKTEIETINTENTEIETETENAAKK